MDYTTREIIECLDLKKPIYSFFTGFFPVKNTHLADKLEFDVKKGKRRMAPFVAPRKGGKVVKRDGFQTMSLKAPRLAPQRIITIDDIDQRGFGENVYGAQSPAERSVALLASDITELTDSITRRLEWMCRETILNGKIVATDPEEGLDVEVDFNFTNKKTLTTSWQDAASDPIADLKAARLECIKKTGKAPTVAILSSDAVDAFKNNKKIQETMDIRNFNLATYQPKIINEAITFIGTISELNIEMYSYDEWFIDDDGDEQPMMPEGTCILLPTEIGSIEYGSVTQLEDGNHQTYVSEIVPKLWADVANDTEMIRLTSRPIPRPYDVDGWYVINGVV